MERGQVRNGQWTSMATGDWKGMAWDETGRKMKWRTGMVGEGRDERRWKNLGRTGRKLKGQGRDRKGTRGEINRNFTVCCMQYKG